jgi:two-component system sensor histidine kinase KdpD
VFAVLPIAVVWGLGYAIVVSIASMLAFNWFFLEPVHTFTLTDSKNWFALAVFVVVGVLGSELANRLRRRAREAALLAELAGSLLEHGAVGQELERISADAAHALQVESVRVLPGDSGGGYPLIARGRRVGSIELEGGDGRGAAARRRLLPALASLLAVAIDRDQLEREALEAEALRRADAMKTALLRAVSHDLRTPLMAISTSAGALARRDLEIDDAGRADLLETIVAASDRLDHLVGNLLDLSRLQAGAAEPDQELCHLDDLVLGALDELGVDSRRVEILLPDDSPVVRVDPGRDREPGGERAEVLAGR